MREASYISSPSGTITKHEPIEEIHEPIEKASDRISFVELKDQYQFQEISSFLCKMVENTRQIEVLLAQVIKEPFLSRQRDQLALVCNIGGEMSQKFCRMFLAFPNIVQNHGFDAENIMHVKLENLEKMNEAYQSNTIKLNSVCIRSAKVLNDEKKILIYTDSLGSAKQDYMSLLSRSDRVSKKMSALLKSATDRQELKEEKEQFWV